MSSPWIIVLSCRNAPLERVRILGPKDLIHEQSRLKTHLPFLASRDNLYLVDLRNEERQDKQEVGKGKKTIEFGKADFKQVSSWKDF